MNESRADRLTGTKKVQHRAVIYIRPDNQTLPSILLVTLCLPYLDKKVTALLVK